MTLSQHDPTTCVLAAGRSLGATDVLQCDSSDLSHLRWDHTGGGMTQTLPLSTGHGEIIAPHTLLTTLILSPDGNIQLDPGALHGRSALESSIQFAPRREQVANPETYWVVWVAVELDASNEALRYQGLSVSELWIDQARRVGYKVLAEHVNRMSEALHGGVNLKTLDGTARALIAQRLASLDADVWEHSSASLREALGG